MTNERPSASRSNADPAVEPTATSSPRSLLGHRRNFLVDRRLQIRAGLLATGVAFLLLTLLNLAVWMLRSQSTMRVAEQIPQLEVMLRAQDRVELWLIAAASLVFLVGVFVVTVLETHRTAGAALNLSRRLVEVERGRFTARVRLRRGDNLHVLEADFNRMAQALQERAWADADALDALAEEAERSAGVETLQPVILALRRLADDRRRLAD